MHRILERLCHPRAARTCPTPTRNQFVAETTPPRLSFLGTLAGAAVGQGERGRLRKREKEGWSACLRGGCERENEAVVAEVVSGGREVRELGLARLCSPRSKVR
jgi:hypothetical protein